MIQKNIDTFIELLQYTFYTGLLVFGAICYAFYITIKAPYSKTRNCLLGYITVALLLQIEHTGRVLLLNENHTLDRISNVVFAFAEHMLISLFFYQLFKEINFKRIMLLANVLLGILLVIFAIVSLDSPKNRVKWEDVIFSVELFVLTGYCLYFYYRVFQSKQKFDLKSVGAFWIITGLFFYCIISLPFFIISYEIFKHSRTIYAILFSIHYIIFAIFFLSISKGIKCKQVLIKL